MPKKGVVQDDKSNRSSSWDEFKIIDGVNGAENFGNISGIDNLNVSRDSIGSMQNDVNNIGDISDIEEPSKTGSNSSSYIGHELSHYAGNEANSDFSAFDEARHKKNAKQKPGKKDHNGPAPKQEEPEKSVFLQEGAENNLSLGNENLINNVINPAPRQPAVQQAQVLRQNQNNEFVAYQKPRSKWSKASQAGSGFLRVLGNTVGKAAVLPASIVGKGLHIQGSIENAAYKKAQKGQQSRNHRAIPGREGEEFDPQKNTGKDILDDFRRVPTVWSYLTAGKAVEANGEEVAPKVTVYLDQPKTGSSMSMNGDEMGHSMIGIEYTRNSMITGKPERYNIKYGYYPAGGMSSTSASAMMLKGAILPGQLADDAPHPYDISKTFPATRRQIEDIAKASEKYTEIGGYGYYTRNCATFVRDMCRVGHVASDATINSIFTEEKVRFETHSNLGLLGTNTLYGFLNTDQQKDMGRLAKSNDLSYQGWGNKRITAEDFDRYLVTQNTAGFGVKTLSSGFAGENVRRMKDGSQLGSFKYMPDVLKQNPDDDVETASIDITDLQPAIMQEGMKLQDKINSIMTPQQREALGEDFKSWFDSLSNREEGIAHLLVAKRQNNGYDEFDEERDEQPIEMLVTGADLKFAYESISKRIESVSKMYQTKLGSDSRINTEVMNLLSVMHIALQVVNAIYQKVGKSDAGAELGTIRENMIEGNYKLSLGEDIEVYMTPSHYESYLQIYKTPEAAVKAYNRYNELKTELSVEPKKKLGDNPKKWKGATAKEWDRLQRNEELARQFDSAHRDMLNKKGFTQGDIDYAFRLRRTEKSGTTKVSTSRRAMSASQTYIALFFDKMFKGISNKSKEDYKKGGLPDNKDKDEFAKWLNNYLTKKTQEKMMGMTMILRGIMRAYDRPRADYIQEAFHYFMLRTYLDKVLATDDDRSLFLIVNIDQIYEKISGNPQMSFTKIINSLTNVVMMENQEEKMLKNGKMVVGKKKRSKP